MWQQREQEKKKDRFCDDWSFRASLNITPLVRLGLTTNAVDCISTVVLIPMTGSRRI